MKKEVDYNLLLNSLKEEKENILSKKNNYRKDLKEVVLVMHEGSLDEYFVKPLSYVSDATRKSQFDHVVDHANSYAANLRTRIKDKDTQIKYLEAMSMRLDKASLQALKYMKDNKNNISKNKLNEIQNLIEFSKEFKEEIPKNHSTLEKTLKAFSITAILFGLFINIPKITGNAIAKTTFGDFSFLGTTLLLLGILGIALTRKTKF